MQNSYLLYAKYRVTAWIQFKVSSHAERMFKVSLERIKHRAYH